MGDFTKTILEYEKDFFNREFCSDIENLYKRIHHDFTEFGRSGKVYDKEAIISYLKDLEENRNIEVLSFRINHMKEDLIIANYISSEKDKGVKALRTSIWIKEEDKWQLYFHQGSKTSQEDLSVIEKVPSIDADIILSNRVKKQLKGYDFDEDDFLRIIAMGKIANEDSPRKHTIIFPIDLDGKKYIVSGKKDKTTIKIERIEINRITI